MRNASLTLFLLTTLSLSALAQTPTPPLTGVSLWPAPTDIRPGTRILVATFTHPDTPYECHLRTLDTAQLTCAGSHGTADAIFNRLAVATILLPPKHHIRVSNIMMGAGAGCLLVAWVVAVHHQFNGSNAAADFAEAGVNLGVAGAITHIFDGNHTPRYEIPLYAAPIPAPAPSSAQTNPID